MGILMGLLHWCSYKEAYFLFFFQSPVGQINWAELLRSTNQLHFFFKSLKNNKNLVKIKKYKAQPFIRNPS